jgi:hypothetical protein
VSDFEDRDPEDRDLQELERRLDAAFASTRPRRGFSDELWRRLQAGRPWWKRLHLPAGAARRALEGLAAVLVIGVLVVTIVRVLPHGGAAGSSAVRSTTSSAAGMPFGPLPRPAGVVPGIQQPAPQTGSLQKSATPGAAASETPAQLPVYRYPASSGPAAGTVKDPDAIPPGFASANYPTLQRSDALREARAGTYGPGPATDIPPANLRLVYVAVTADGFTYLEPAYQEGGVLVSALAPAAFQR